MKKYILLFTILLLSQLLSGQRIKDNLDRGLIIIPSTEGNFISWRKFPSDIDKKIAYKIIKDGIALSEDFIFDVSNFVDPEGKPSSKYRVEFYADGKLEGTTGYATPWEQEYLEIPTLTPPNYKLNDASVGDLDGDGQLEVIVKLENRSKDNSQKGYTDPVKLHAYTLEGEWLWEIDLGINIRAGAHYTQFMVFDLDGDGKAEIACKTAPGTKDGSGNFLSSGPAAEDDDTADYRNGDGYILKGPEYLTVFNGETGKEVTTVYYNPPRHPDTENPSSNQLNSLWGDGYGNRVDRFLACVAFFDNKPSLVMCRGYYTRTVLAAWDFDGENLSQRWVFDSRNSGLFFYSGQGAHSLSVGDVDNDGKDEIMYGAMAVDDNGEGLYTTYYKHGDATHLSDFLPERPGLEFYMPHESAGSLSNGLRIPGISLRDALTGEIIWQKEADGDIGRGMTADISAEYPGNEFWASSGLHLFSSSGEKISDVRPPVNFAIWWDGDLLREMLDKNEISKWTPSGMVNILTATDCESNNGTKATPALSGDILGDWREEVIWRAKDNQSLRIYSTTVPTETGIPSLLFDPQYRLALVWQNVAYNQPPHPGFFIGHGMTVVSATKESTIHDIRLFPNPASKGFSIKGEKNSEVFDSVRMYNTEGKLIIEMEDVPSGKFIELSGYPNGSYFITAKTSDIIYHGILVVQN